MSKKLAFFLSLALAGLPTAAGALGLGEIKLNSALNDKFSADIQVVGATSDELDSLDVKLASLNQFNQAGLDHPDVLGQLQFLVVRNPDGTAYIHITSSQGVREPFLDFLIDANWNNGELIREYTVLLNPPNLQTAEATKPQAAPAAPAAAPAASAPVPAPSTATAPVAAAPSAATTAPQTEAPQAEAPVAVAPQTPAPTASPPAAPAPSLEQAPAQRALGANYGPIHRGETLSGIAKSVRPEGVTLNQLMIAIYQANPEVFSHNINRMKAGMIMRMPSLADVQAVSVADANTEVRTQMEEWRAGRSASTSAAPEAAQPALTLVAPSSAAETSAPVPGAEKSGTAETPAAPAPAPQAPAKNSKSGKPSAPAAAAPAAPTPSQAPISVNSNALSSMQQQAQQQAAAPTPSVLPPPATPKNEPLPAPKPETPKPVAAQPAASGGGFLDAILNVYVLGVAVLVFAVVVIGIVIKKRRQSVGSKPMTPARIKGADWMKQEQAGGPGDDPTEVASSTTRTKGGKAKQAKAAMQETAKFSTPPAQADDDGDKTQLMSASAAQSMAETAVHDTMVGGAAASASLDVSDPMAEADFHMAYGLYDQAADTLRKALKQNPDRRDVQVKLLEVFFTAGDKANFVAEAKKLREAPGGGGKDWESVVIMGRQVAPDEPLFTSGGGGAAAVDIALEGGGTDTVVSDMDALAGAFSGMEAPGASAPEPAPSAPAAAPADNLMDFSLPDLEPTPAAAPAAPAAPAMETPAAPAAGGGLEFNIDDLNFEPTPAKKGREEPKATPPADEPTVATDFGTDSQVEFDKALNDLASFVNTNVPVQEAAAEPEDKTMAIKVKPAMPETADLGSISAEEPVAAGGTSLSEVGTKLDLARAYIDMGDPEGAKSILEEVIGEGNAQQKSEAQELMKHVS